MPHLLLNRRRILHHLPDWFPDSRENLIVVTTLAAEPRPDRLSRSFRHLAVLDDYNRPEQFPELLRLCRDHRVERILTTGEHDLETAARLRETLDLPGQRPAGATAYRDKSVMKTLVAAAGVRVAPMRLVFNTATLLAFADEVGLPVVVKPIDGGGGAGIRVLRSLADLATQGETLKTPQLAEAWIEGDFYQVNGLMRQGRVQWSQPSRNLHPDLATLTHGTPGLSGMLRERHPLFDRLQRATTKTVAALPPVPELRPLHAEFFHTADDELLLCEIACRAGGAGIVETHERAFGVNLHAAGLLGQAGRPVPSPAEPLAQRCGFAWFPPQDGLLARLPERCPLPHTVRYTAVGTPGRHYRRPRALGPHVAQLIFDQSGADVLTDLHQVANWWHNTVLWQPAPPALTGEPRG